ncbi:MAG: dipeptide ABC transporter ATP-binding protein, partial [Microvirga sp.]
MGLLPKRGVQVTGSVRLDGQELIGASTGVLRRLRGADMAMVFQDPLSSLNPTVTIGVQVTEVLHEHEETTRKAAQARAAELLGEVGIPDPARRMGEYPHQLSGGMRQRALIAMALACSPRLLIADEPTTALDVTIQAQILELLRELNRDFGTAIVLISHDLGVIAGVCARVVVMYAGEVVEEGSTEEVLSDPRHPYTWALINAVPRIDRHTPGNRRLTTIEGAPPDPLDLPQGCRFAPRCPFRIERCTEHPELLAVAPGRDARCWVTQAGGRLALPPSSSRLRGEGLGGEAGEASPQAEGEGLSTLALDPEAAPHPVAPEARAGLSRQAGKGERLLEVRGLVKHFPLPKNGFFQKRLIVHAVDGVDLDVARGETVGLVGESGCGKSTLARVLIRIHKPDAGSIVFEGEDIARASAAEIRPLRKRMQMVFQDPYASLNPRMTVADIIGEPLRFHGLAATAAETREQVAELLSTVGLSPKAAQRYPHEFSGGQRQRISIARALAVRPDFIIADEPISALDVNIQAQIINLMLELQEKFGLTYLFIAHDLAVVRHISDRIVVLYLGKVVEVARSGVLFERPLHPYTRYLISAVPVPDVAVERRRQHLQLKGEPPSAVDPPSGCRFRTRCPIARAVCAEVPPPLAEHQGGHFAACHFAGEFQPDGGGAHAARHG